MGALKVFSELGGGLVMFRRGSARTGDPSRSNGKKDLVKKAIGDLVNEYLTYKRATNTAKTMRSREGRVMQPLQPLLRCLPNEVDAPMLANALLDWCDGKSPSTARQAIQEAKAFWVWMAEEELLREQPWDKKVLRRLPRNFPKKSSRQDRQFTIDEAAQLEEYLLRAAPCDDAAMVALYGLEGGFRISEILSLLSRNVDAGGRVIWIRDAKTPAGRRATEMPPHVVGVVGSAKNGKAPFDRLFPYTADQIRPRIKRHYVAAGVPELDIHALRRTNATLRVVGGQAPEAITTALGHASFEMTKGNYVATGTVENAGQANLAKVLKIR